MAHDEHSKHVKAYYHTFESVVGYRLMVGESNILVTIQIRSNCVADAQLAENDLVAKALRVKEGDSLLECGCGEGSAANYLADKYGLDITGIDLLPQNIKRARKFSAGNRNNSSTKGTAKFMIGDYLELPFENNTFDGLYALETLVHASDSDKLFTGLYDALKPGGKLVFAEYSMTPREQLSKHAAEVMTRVNRYSCMPSLEVFTTGSFPAVLQKAGFQSIKVTDITANFMPTLRYFYRRARVPNKIFKTLRIENHFINAYAAAELYRLHSHGEDVVQYNLVEATKSRH